MGLTDLEQHTAIDKQAKSALENLLSAHTFDYIAVRVTYGLTSCEDLAMAVTACKYRSIACVRYKFSYVLLVQ